MLGGADVVAFVATTDADRATAFYGDLLGLALVEQTRFACLFTTPNAELRVTIVSELSPAPYTVLGWRVADVEARARALRAAGVEALRYEGMEQDELGIWTSPSGARVLWFQDPDGNILSITQS
jgi:catechol 2,3-dioxygenase-like lactoylglutathione lyase family enzyme